MNLSTSDTAKASPAAALFPVWMRAAQAHISSLNPSALSMFSSFIPPAILVNQSQHLGQADCARCVQWCAQQK